MGNVYHHEAVLIAACLTSNTYFVLGVSKLDGMSLGL